MKRYINSSEPIVAMAIINPKLCNTIGIQVELEQRNEGPIPHLHVYLDNSRDPSNCAYIRLDKAAYSDHHRKGSRKEGKKLNKKSKANFINIMESLTPESFIRSVTTDDARRATGYEYAVSVWRDTFGETVKFNYDEDGYPIMPDYSML